MTQVSPRAAMTIELYGGPLNGRVSQVRELPPVIYAEDLNPPRVLDDLNPMQPMPRQIAHYEPVRGSGGVPERDGGGHYIYRFKGYEVL